MRERKRWKKRRQKRRQKHRQKRRQKRRGMAVSDRISLALGIRDDGTERQKVAPESRSRKQNGPYAWRTKKPEEAGERG